MTRQIIQQLVNNYTAISFQVNNNDMVLFHPSPKTEGKFQVTFITDGVFPADTQHNTKQDAAKRIAEYDRLEVLEAIV